MLQQDLGAGQCAVQRRSKYLQSYLPVSVLNLPDMVFFGFETSFESECHEPSVHSTDIVSELGPANGLTHSVCIILTHAESQIMAQP